MSQSLIGYAVNYRDTAKILQPPWYFIETIMNLNKDNNRAVNQSTEVQMRVALVDAISEVQCLNKPEWIKQCLHLTDHFASCISETFHKNKEIRLNFSR